MGKIKKPSPKQWLLIFSIIIVAVLAFLISSLSGSSNGTISGNTPVTKPAAPIKELTKDGRYISFSYPSDFTVSPIEKLSGNELETFAFIKRPSPFWFLNITLSSLPSGNLADNGSYNSRITQPEHYSKTSLPINGQLVDVFSDTTVAYSKAAFMTHSGRVVSVALSADASEEGLDKILADVLTSINWR